MSFDPFDHDIERGMRNRRAILGDAWVDKSVSNANAFNADFQNFITRYAWHEIWGRPGLELRTRRVIVLAITAALSRWEEFELHTRAALTGGGPGGDPASRLTPEEVREVLMQTAIYAGVPAANTAMSITNKLLRELGIELPPADAAQAAHPGSGSSHRTTSRPHLHYTLREPGALSEAEGAGRHTFVLSHALGCDVSMWDRLANSLVAQGHRVICYDHRGHGGSESPPGPYTVEQLAADAARLIEELQASTGCGQVVWVGLSMGGMVGQALALARPELLKALVIANSSSAYDAAGREAWQQRIDLIRAQGLEAIADGAMQRWFGEEFRRSQPATVARWRRRVVSNEPEGYIATCEALRLLDLTGRLGAIRLPTLVIAGEIDPGTPVAMSKTIVQHIAGSSLVVLPGLSHLSVLEDPVAFEAALRPFVERL
ncbi:alpha/beta fold hydrolase [Rivibacter subsaxonicus]|uniref:3-oxoadipate enol-lactonase n=1 Tax=Rivibacter subsaxonicus TaxID=457575 RepID=A0A4Q7VVQ2_9BURK|nr:alpha/beta fold hydrolase [Rivibacter subsaxonicus]RZU00720.1 3-oxoadipate enol-lactonase [Rivibacter subsaxonicus]